MSQLKVAKRPKYLHSNHPAISNPDWVREIYQHSAKANSWLRVGGRLRRSAVSIYKSEEPVAMAYWAELRRVSASNSKSGDIEDFNESKFPFPNFDACHLLIGLAIENLLKGLAVAKGIVTFVKDDLPLGIKTHDLWKLHKFVDPAATVSRNILETLTYMVEWRARYPLPIRSDQFWRFDSTGQPQGGGMSWPDFYVEAFRYCDELTEELRQMVEYDPNK